MNTIPSTSVPEAPLPSSSKPPSYLLVLFSGLATTALTLLGIYWMNINVPNFNVMGWYVQFVIPAGAIIVGIVAALGYGIASWISGIKIVRSLFWAVLFFQISAYAVAQYLEYKHALSLYPRLRMGFFEYFDIMTRSFVWKSTDSTGDGTHLGVWGYGCRALEVIGFACGGLIVPLVMSTKSYCDDCRRYMKRRHLGLLPASVAPRKIKKSDTEGKAALEAEQQKAFESAQEMLGMFREMAMEGRADDFQKAIDALKTRKKETAKLLVRYQIDLVFCNQCHKGRLRILQLVGQGKKLQQKEQASIDLPNAFVAALQAKK